jgi:hypothetical protein
MKNRRIGLLDIGLDAGFDASMMFVQSVIQNINAGFDEPIADVDFVRSRDPYVVSAAMTSPCDVLHVMAHGDHLEDPNFSSSDGKTTLSLSGLNVWCQENNQPGISAGAVLADGCKTGIGVWQSAIRNLLQGPVTYIGTSTQVNWHDGTVFCSAFYGSLFRNKGQGFTPAEQAKDAAGRAIKAYTILTGRRCPYKIMELTPSRTAMRAFG